MSKRKVAVSHNIRVNVGNYQHIDSTFYAEEEIEYSNEQELLAAQDKLNDDVVLYLIRSLNALPERLGKDTNAVQEVEESIKKAIPEWLEKDPIPNMANKAKTNHQKVVSEQKQSKDKEVAPTKVNVESPKKTAKVEKIDAHEVDDLMQASSEFDLFAD